MLRNPQARLIVAPPCISKTEKQCAALHVTPRVFHRNSYPFAATLFTQRSFQNLNTFFLWADVLSHTKTVEMGSLSVRLKKKKIGRFSLPKTSQFPTQPRRPILQETCRTQKSQHRSPVLVPIIMRPGYSFCVLTASLTRHASLSVSYPFNVVPIR